MFGSAVGKRSPILGYNHNVRYRGLVFHVQSEDSGVSTPHLFTHLFHHGVIVSTRKLVYDAGSAEESIKSLMQAQHKAVLKDLRRGHFDDKIDSYLGGTPGLLPRGEGEAVVRPFDPATARAQGASGEPMEASEVELAPSSGAVDDDALGVPTEQVVFDELSAPVMIVEQAQAPSPLPRPIATPPPVPSRPPAVARPPVPGQRLTPAPGIETTLRTEAPVFDPAPEAEPATEEEIEIQLDVDDGDGDEASPEVAPPRRAMRDTENQLPFGHHTRPTLTISDTKPTLGMINEEAKRAAALSDGIPGAMRPPSPMISSPPSDSRKPGDRPQAINAATLPAPRPISRPQSRPALSPPQVVSRPVAEGDRSRRESETVEVYSPALPSAELPPGDRHGQYAQHKKVSTRIPLEGLKDAPSEAHRTDAKIAPRTDPKIEPRPEQRVEHRIEPRAESRIDRPGAPIPAGLGRPPRAAPPTLPAPPRPGAPSPPSAMIAPSGSAPAGSREPLPRSGAQTEQMRARVPAPAVSRTGTAGVVMTRPAVIVGGPPKSPGTVPRIRKAREDEGRGFGQGLISEKSLDEVILAYLSEDADDK
jgi:hypothetical protein